MRASYEKITPPTDGSFRCFRRVEPAFAFDWHYHAEAELTLIERGRGRRVVGDHLGDYAAGDLVLIGPNLPHTWASEADETGDASAVVVQFDRAKVDDLAGAAPELAGVVAMLDASARGLRFDADASREAIDRLGAMPGESAPRRLVSLIEVLVRLGEAAGGARVLASAGYAPALNEESRGRIERVCRHIHEHLSDPLEQAGLAAMVSMNAAAFSRFFKRATGRTLTDYVNELRIARACRLLTETDLSVLDVCYRSGFNNVANFNRRFRESKAVTPSAFRRAMRP